MLSEKIVDGRRMSSMKNRELVPRKGTVKTIEVITSPAYLPSMAMLLFQMSFYFYFFIFASLCYVYNWFLMEDEVLQFEFLNFTLVQPNHCRGKMVILLTVSIFINNLLWIIQLSRIIPQRFLFSFFTFFFFSDLINFVQ